jgi:hypothetical protein
MFSFVNEDGYRLILLKEMTAYTWDVLIAISPINVFFDFLQKKRGS